MKTTILNETHKNLGAKMVAFAGYEMPVTYTSIIDEHMAVRTKAGLFDVSHMGEFIVKGKEALKLVQAVISNDASKLEIGQALYACLPNDNGGVVDDLLVYRLDQDQCSEGEQAFMLVVNASNIKKDFDWIESKNSFDTRLIDISNQTSLLALQGPLASKVLSKLTDVAIETLSYYHFTKGEVSGIKNVLISATGYTGSGGFELYVRNEDVEELWNVLLETGAEYGILPCGLGCRDTLRLEMGYSLYGHELDDATSPIEAGLAWITKLKKEADFPSKDIFVKQKREGVSKRLIAIKMDGKRVPRQGYEIFDALENKIGSVTSGTHSPMLDIPIALGYINQKISTGEEVLIGFGKKKRIGTVTKLPFVKV